MLEKISSVCDSRKSSEFLIVFTCQSAGLGLKTYLVNNLDVFSISVELFFFFCKSMSRHLRFHRC